MKERSMGPIGNDCDFKNFAEEKICKLFVVAIDFIALEFYRKLQKMLWIFGSTEHLYSCTLFQEMLF